MNTEHRTAMKKMKKTSFDSLKAACGRTLRVFWVWLVFMASSGVGGVEAAGPFDVAVLLSSGIRPYRQAFEGFRQELGARHGEARLTEYDLSVEDPARVARRIADRQPALLFTVGPEATRLAREEIRDLPVVFAMVLHPEAFTGANIAGVSLEIPFRLKLEKIGRILPEVRKIGIIYSPATVYDWLEDAGGPREDGFRVVVREIESGRDFPETFKDLSWQVDLFVMVPDTAIYFPRSIEYLLAESLKSGVPVVGLSSSYTRAGALLSLEADYFDIGVHAALLAARIIEGEEPENIGIQFPDEVFYSINLLVAEKLKVKLAPGSIEGASEVFGR